MASEELTNWLKTQRHQPQAKITNLQRPLLKFLPPSGITTWGEWYDQVGIEVPSIPKKDQIKGEPLKANSVLKDLNMAKRNLQVLQDEINIEQPGSADYNKLITNYTNLDIKIQNLTNQYEDLKATEENIDKVGAAKKKTGTLKDQIANLERSKKRLADLKQDTATVDDQIKKLKGDLQTTRKVIKETDTTPNYVPPKPGPTGPTAGTGPKGPKAPTGPTGPKAPTTATGPTKPAGSTGPANPNKPVVPTQTAEDRRAAGLELGAGADKDFTLPETIFNNVPSLKKLLQEYSDPKVKMSDAEFLKRLRSDVWYTKNSGAIKNRYVQLYNYQDLVKTGQAQGTTQYEQDITKLERQLADKARKAGSGLASDPTALRKAAENMYITNVGIDDAMTTDFIAAAIRPVTSTLGGQATEGYSGQALKDYQAIQSIAKANGFKISDILPGGQNEQQVLQGISKGIIDPDRLAQDARKIAAQGQPEYVRDLLGQGYNLDQIYSPYKQTMASILEVNPDQIDLNDPTLRSAITDQGDMNIYDFKKLLKADNRWQYTENARQEVSDSALKVLRDFGFQG
jgi:hypothetical protein